MNQIIPFYKFTNEAGDEPTSAELLIFDVIGDWEDFGEVSAKAFAKDLSALPKSVKRLDIHINSPGGSVTEAMAIYSRLADHASNKMVYIDGIAASAATLVAMVGHKIYIRANATMMIHMPHSFAMGTAEDMRKQAAALDSIAESIINLYQRRTGRERDAIRNLMQAETWFEANKAVEDGFADEVRGVVKAAALLDGSKRVVFNGLTFDLSRFQNVPAFNAQQQEPKTMQTLQVKPKAEATPPGDPQTPPSPPQPPAPANPPPAGNPPPPAPAPATPPPPAAATNEREAGVQAERARIAALMKYDRPNTHELITNAIKDGKTVADITDELFAAMENKSHQQARHSDARQLDQIPPGDPQGGGEGEDFGVKLTNAVKAQLNRRGQKRSVVHGRN